MATKKISELLPLETVSANLQLTVIPVLDTSSGITKKVTLQQLNDSIEANIPFAAAAFTQANIAFNNASTADQKALTAGNYANSAFNRANNSLNVATGGSITGDISITGNVSISGCTATLIVNTLRTSDHIIDIGYGTSGTPSQNAGIRVFRGDSNPIQLRWNEFSDKWQFTNDGFIYFDFSTADSVRLDSAYNQANIAFNTANTSDEYSTANTEIWNTSTPTTIQSAIDRLANLVYTLNSNTPIP